MSATWYGELPERWDLKRVGALFSENTTSNADLLSDVPMQFRFGEIIRKQAMEKDEVFLDSIRRYIVIQSNDIMVNGLNLNYDFVTQRVAIVREKGCMTPAYISLRSNRLINPYFACYLLKAMDGQKILNGLGTGIRLTLGFSELKKTYLPLPPRDEQDQIVRYLDWKVSQINKLINVKRRQIALLLEQRQAIINRTVTKGINPDAAMRNSEITWLGEIPETWCIVRFGQCINAIEQGWSPAASEDVLDDRHWKVLTLSSIKKGEFFPDAVKPIDVNASVPTKLEVHDGDFLLTRSNTRELVGDICIAKNVQPKTIICDLIYRLQLAETMIVPCFAAYFLLSSYGRMQIQQDARGSSGTMPKLAHKHIRSWNITLPSIPEQNIIVKYIDKQVEPIKRAIHAIKEQIVLLDEYRTRLISDAVTGKLDVRGVSVPEYETVVDVVGDKDAEIDSGESEE